MEDREEQGDCSLKSLCTPQDIEGDDSVVGTNLVTCESSGSGEVLKGRRFEQGDGPGEGGKVLSLKSKEACSCSGVHVQCVDQCFVKDGCAQDDEHDETQTKIQSYETFESIAEYRDSQINSNDKEANPPGQPALQDVKQKKPETKMLVFTARFDPATDNYQVYKSDGLISYNLNGETDTEAEPHPGVRCPDDPCQERTCEDLKIYVNPDLNGREVIYEGPTSRPLAQLHNLQSQEDEEDYQSDNTSIMRGSNQYRPSPAHAGFLRSNAAHQTLKRKNKQDVGPQKDAFVDHNSSAKRICPGYDARNQSSNVSRSSHQQKNYLEESDVQIPIPYDLSQYSWLMKSALRFELGTSGYAYDGEICSKKMHGRGRLTLERHGQFLEGKWAMNRLIELDFGRFTLYGGKYSVFIIKRINDYLLTLYENLFVARVVLNSIDELDFSKSIKSVKETFFKKLTVLEISVDEVEYQRHSSLGKFESLLKSMVSEDADPIIRANTLILFSKYSQNVDATLPDLLQDPTISKDLREAITVFQTQESLYLKNSFMMKLLNKPVPTPLNFKELVSRIYSDGIKEHRRILVTKCPRVLSTLLSELQDMDESKIVYLTRADIDVFDHLVSQPCFEQYKAFIINVAERFIQTLCNIRPSTPPSTVIPMLSPVFGFLVKSFWDIGTDIIEATEGYQYKDMLKNESGNWVIEDEIKFPVDENQEKEKRGLLNFFRPSVKKSSLYHQSLEIQYKILFQMMKHFLPDNFISKKKYEYNFKVLEQDLSFWEKGMKMVKKSVGLAKRLANLSGERLIWLYILDHTVHEVFKDNPKYHVLLKPYNSILQGQISFIEKAPAESYESFRALTHSVVRFVMSTAPYFKDAKQEPDVDVEILVEQMWTFSSASQDIEQDPSAFSNFRDLIAEYNRYLSLRLFIDIEAASGHFSTQLSDLIQTFMRIVGTSLKKKYVPNTALVVYFRSLNDFLDDFKNIDFLRMWFVKSFFNKPEIMKKVDNKLSNGRNCSYLVTDIEKFVQEFKLIRHQPPNHYVIRIVSRLLDCLETCLKTQWQSANEAELQVAQLESTSVMLDAVRQSFMYLKEQPDYLDFDAFYQESVDPFVLLMNECSTPSDLKKRVNIVKESFWYIRKMDEIGIDQALMMLKNINDCPGSDKLLNCYNLYVNYFGKYISEYSSLLSKGKSHSDGLVAVRKMLRQIEPLHFSEWTEEFRTTEIPILLAGSSAVWSILISKDVSSTGKFLKPHCIQILGVLRLLSVDGSGSVNNHLAQVLTGQGKSLITGLLSSIFALTGHEVTVMCYSEYLSNRDKNEFNDFFQTFGITDMIEFATFEEMADTVLNPTFKGLQVPLRQLVTARVLTHTDWSSLNSEITESKNKVLLIDEVDVFFSGQFYGNRYRPVSTIELDGLTLVQEKMWELATSEFNVAQITQLTRDFIAEGVANGIALLSELSTFINKPGTFSLLNDRDGGLCVTQYTNQSLFDEHLRTMAEDAHLVVLSSDNHSTRSGFILNDKENVCAKCKGSDIYSEDTFSGYKNVFNYFRLKGSKYDHNNFQNYGYLMLTSGEISYARLPSQFPLILGVSGTITSLVEYEKRAIESYNIRNSSILPSFFGDSNLKFNKDTDFHCFNQQPDWLKEIFNRANQLVESRRALLVFFESEVFMKHFLKEYKTKFDRLNEITENTVATKRDAYIVEAGLPCTVTLATRYMGRGVDYKSSLSVEKNGGVHVIQTFYSTDVKEEIQIKGRTARKDNQGSYEMIICREHLVKNRIIKEEDDSSHNYSSLDIIRQQLSNEKGKTVTENIEKCERNHITTMKYFGLA